MPWTIAHAAAVLPLRHVRRLPFSALVAGSMAPDFGYYIGRFDLASPSHSLFPGLLLSIPIGLAMLASWRMLGPSACLALPSPIRDGFRSSFQDELVGSTRCLMLTCVALMLGSFSHIAWDSLTHARGWFVYHNPFMRTPVQLGHFYSLPRYRLLQHLSTLIGMAALLVAWRHSLPEADPGDGWRPKVERLRTALLFALLVAAVGMACLSVPVLDPQIRIEERVYRIALVAPIWFGAMLCFAGLVLRRIRQG